MANRLIYGFTTVQIKDDKFRICMMQKCNEQKCVITANETIGLMANVLY